MKKQILVLLTLFLSITIFAQKDELKSAEKAIKKQDYAVAQTFVDQAEPLISNSDNKTKAKFYYLQAMTYTELSKADPNNYDKAASAYNNLFEIEKEMGSTKYTTMAEPELNVLISDVSAKGIKSYQDKDYVAAKDELYRVYLLSPLDTAYLEYAANAAYMSKDYDAALDYFTQLKEVGYTGIFTEYSAKNNDTGTREVFDSKHQSDLMKKSKIYSDFKVTTSESKKPDVIKNIAYAHVELGDTDKALAAVSDARKIAPKDVGLILTEANLQIKLGNKEEFASLMKEAIELDPDNPTLYYNLGVIGAEQGLNEKNLAIEEKDKGNMEKAEAHLEKSIEYLDKTIGYYNKAIKLNPDYADAYVNLGSVMLEEDKELVEEMNNNLSNFDKYDKIKAKQVELYKEAIPVYEKAYELKPDDIDTVRVLMSLYENAQMDDKFLEIKKVYESLK